MSDTSRRVTPRTWAVAGSVAAIALTGVQIAPAGRSLIPAAYAGEASEAGESGHTTPTSEAGEAGEAGIVVPEGPAEFLTELGKFEATHLIVAALYASGDTAQAVEHLEQSHHAYYDDLEHDLEEYGAREFEDEAEDFADLVTDGASAKKVAKAADKVMTAIAAARKSIDAPARDQLFAAKALLDTAAADYAAGVDETRIEAPQEYRDAWGFVEAARIIARELAASEDDRTAKAGQDALAQIDTVAPLFPALSATQAGGDLSLLAAAAAWVEIIGLRLK